MSKRKFHYNPSLSVKENAKRNRCSESNVRKFIYENGIDRRYERKAAIINEIRKLTNETPSITISEIASKTRHSINTIKLYYDYAIGVKVLSKIATPKIVKTDVRELRDYYATHPSVVRDILRLETFHHNVLEPCCGGGYMAEEIKKAGYEVYAYDIVDRGYGRQADFLTNDWEIGKMDVITNPPYTSVVDFIRKSLEICKDKVAILMPLRYLSSWERYDFYKENPPCRVYVYTNRICIAKNGKFEDFDKGQNLEIFAWYIWQRGYKGDTILRWITNIEKGSSTIVNQRVLSNS